MPGALNVLELVQNGSMSAEMASVLWAAMDDRRSFIVAAGPRQAGKSTTTEAILDFLPSERPPPRPDGRSSADGRPRGVPRRRLPRRARVQRPHALVPARRASGAGLRHGGPRASPSQGPSTPTPRRTPSRSCTPMGPSRTTSSQASAFWCSWECAVGRRIPCAGCPAFGRSTACPTARRVAGLLCRWDSRDRQLRLGERASEPLGGRSAS